MIQRLRCEPPIYSQAQRYAHLRDEMGPLSPACWSWTVTETDLEEARNCPEHFGHVLLWNWQRGRCAICECQVAEDMPLYRDHDHNTGLIRGLLCNPCNAGEGFTALVGQPGYTVPYIHGYDTMRSYERWRSDDKNQFRMERFERYRLVNPCTMLRLTVRHAATIAPAGLSLPNRYDGDLLILDIDPRVWIKFHKATRVVPGQDRRLEDLWAYVEWRTKHPDTPLPTRRRRAKAARDTSSTEEE